MFLKIFLVTAAAFLSVSLAHPLARVETNPELTAGFVEGDMVLNTTSRNGLRNPVYRWPNNTVYYKFYSLFDDTHKSYILNAMRTIESASCIRFKEASDNIENYIFITNYPEGCYSNLGYLNQGPQTYNLGIRCYRLGTIFHEFLHTLGFFHMQNNPNRDEYVRIAEENVMPGYLHFLKKYNKDEVDDYGEEYDYGSVLHYAPDTFSINGKLTIIPLKEGVIDIMGQRKGMSQSDIKKLNAMYRC